MPAPLFSFAVPPPHTEKRTRHIRCTRLYPYLPWEVGSGKYLWPLDHTVQRFRLLAAQRTHTHASRRSPAAAAVALYCRSWNDCLAYDPRDCGRFSYLAGNRLLPTGGGRCWNGPPAEACAAAAGRWWAPAEGGSRGGGARVGSQGARPPPPRPPPAAAGRASCGWVCPPRRALGLRPGCASTPGRVLHAERRPNGRSSSSSSSYSSYSSYCLLPSGGGGCSVPKDERRGEGEVGSTCCASFIASTCGWAPPLAPLPLPS